MPGRAGCSRRDATSLLLCNEKQARPHARAPGATGLLPPVPVPKPCESPARLAAPPGPVAPGLCLPFAVFCPLCRGLD